MLLLLLAKKYGISTLDGVHLHIFYFVVHKQIKDQTQKTCSFISENSGYIEYSFNKLDSLFKLIVKSTSIEVQST